MNIQPTPTQIVPIPNAPSGYSIPNGSVQFGFRINAGSCYEDGTDPTNVRAMMFGTDGVFYAYDNGGTIKYESAGPLAAELNNISRLPPGATAGYAILGVGPYDGDRRDDGESHLQAAIQLFTTDNTCYWTSHDAIGDVPGTGYFASTSYFYLDANGF